MADMPIEDGSTPAAGTSAARRKIAVGELAVPFEEVSLTTGETMRLYDTSGPQGHDAEQGLPPAAPTGSPAGPVTPPPPSSTTRGPGSSPRRCASWPCARA
jgi:hypothetical protein